MWSKTLEEQNRCHPPHGSPSEHHGTMHDHWLR
ncbi:hypothetical protein ACHAW6_013231 [Cyclotella cf. meneghiniana]